MAWAASEVLVDDGALVLVVVVPVLSLVLELELELELLLVVDVVEEAVLLVPLLVVEVVELL